MILVYLYASVIIRVLFGFGLAELGNPHPDTWLILHKFFGTKSEEELRQLLLPLTPNHQSIRINRDFSISNLRKLSLQFKNIRFWSDFFIF